MGSGLELESKKVPRVVRWDLLGDKCLRPSLICGSLHVPIAEVTQEPTGNARGQGWGLQPLWEQNQ